MKQFTKGIFIGAASTIAALAGAALTFHKNVIKPVEEQEEKFDENRKAAIRKGRSAHQI
ncbi:MAG TPA: DUF3042 family protein [Candidatus Limosilactobacillus intestinigallinarum]|nr:DUF3042 family protein [Candidatus Limosilactobacillus intestinigallinarum]